MTVCWTYLSVRHVCLLDMFFYRTCLSFLCLFLLHVFIWDMYVEGMSVVGHVCILDLSYVQLDMFVCGTCLSVGHVCLWDMSVCGTCVASILCPLCRTQYGSGDTPGRSTRRADIRAGTGFPFTIRPLHLHVVPGPPVVVFRQPFGSLEPKNSKRSLEDRL
jgi:hypothetical protein